MSTIAEQRIHTTSIRQGLRQFATLPDWLIAAADPDTFCAAIGRAAPELAAGDLAITECDIGHIRIKRDVWVGVYELRLPIGSATNRAPSRCGARFSRQPIPSQIRRARRRAAHSRHLAPRDGAHTCLICASSSNFGRPTQPFRHCLF